MNSDTLHASLQVDLKTLTTMELRQKYRGEANTHGNMKSRVKSRGAKVHPDFSDFREFLRHVGPKPTNKATLDRINNDDPEYAPGKVRWADKKTQNSNKSDSLIFHCPLTGRYYTPSQLAAKQKLTAAAIRNRRRHGWTDAEVVAGFRNSSKVSTPSAPQPSRGPRPTRPLSAAEIQFIRDREYCEFHRREHGTEYFVMTPAELYEIMAEDIPEIMRGPMGFAKAEEHFLKDKLPRWWKQHRPHINFLALRRDQQEWILRIDPQQARKLELAKAL